MAGAVARPVRGRRLPSARAALPKGKIDHGIRRFEQPTASVAVDIFRIGNGRLQEHWDVLQDEATPGTSLSGMPMFGDAFPGEG